MGEPIEKSYMSKDGTDFMNSEPAPFDQAWFSHKFHGPGVRYALAVSLEIPSIVLANGPWPCGAYSDVRIFQDGLKNMLRADEFVIADSGYTDERCIRPPVNNHPNHRLMSIVRARHEILNKRLQQFFVLKNRFRQNLSLNRDCFFAVLNITQVMLQDEPLFAIDF